MVIASGRRFLHYRLIEKIGEGGMGVVWKAVDTKLDREVAIKILPDAFASVPERLARFEREAKTLASLNHSNIATVYGLHEVDDLRFIAMELAPGEDLAHRLARCALPIEEALDVARQVSEALEAAHEHGVIHRDLKPANIRVGDDGTVKVLDFGLAKALSAEPAETDPSLSPTVTSGGTRAGVILGTAAYMSPEQARGKPLDKRTDIWSFGCVLYECLSGRRAFRGETTTDILSAILQTEPDWSVLPERTPQRVQELLQRCLEKESRNRLRDIGDARLEIEKAIAGREFSATGVSARTSLPTPRRNPWTSIAWFLLVAALVVIIAVLGIVHYRGVSTEEAVIRSFVPAPEGTAFLLKGPPSGPVEISPDGRHLVFVASEAGQNMIWIRSLDSLTARPLPGTEGGYRPFWSVDSRHIGFFGNGKLKRIAIDGGPATTLCDAPEGRGGTWSRDDVIVFADRSGGPLVRISASGGQPLPATELDESVKELSHRFPSFLPDGRHFLYVADNQQADLAGAAIHLGSIDSAMKKRIMSTSGKAVYASGHLLFTRGQTLMVQPFDSDRLTITGDAVPIAQEISLDVNFRQAAFSASQNGILAYQTGEMQWGRLVWSDRSGKQLGTVADPISCWDVSLAADGKTAILTVNDPEKATTKLWKLDLDRGVRTRFTFDDASDLIGTQSPDERWVVYSSSEGYGWDVRRIRSDGTGASELVRRVEGLSLNCTDWLPGGEKLICHGFEGTSENTDLYLVPLDGDAELERLTETPAREYWPKLSPDGRWIAYRSDESGVPQIYVRAFPSLTGKWQISTAGGGQPRWRSDGKELFYVAPDNAVMAARVETGPSSLAVSGIETLFRADFARQEGYQYDVTADGERFLVNVERDEAAKAPITLVVNWTADLEH